MPTYDFACAACGPFELRVDHRDAGQLQACPACGEHAPRTYAAPSVRSPARPFGSASRALRARVDRARTGQPVVHEGSPRGRELAAARHAQAHHGPHQPWAIGH